MEKLVKISHVLKVSFEKFSTGLLFSRRSELKVSQWCPTLCDSMDDTVHGILQARILECIAVPSSGGSSQLRDRTQASHIAGRFCTSGATGEAHFLGRYFNIIF